MKYRVSSHKIPQNNKYSLKVENEETGTTFIFSRPIKDINSAIRVMTEHLNNGGYLFRFNWWRL